MNRLAWVALACTAIALGQTGESAADLAARYLPERNCWATIPNASTLLRASAATASSARCS
jgi:hypothetical protein